MEPQMNKVCGSKHSLNNSKLALARKSQLADQAVPQLIEID